MSQTLFTTPRIRSVLVRPEIESALRDVAFVLALTQRVREEVRNEEARR